MGVFAGRSRQPLAAFLCCCLAALIFSAVVLPAVQTARAQDDEAKADAAPTEPQQQPSLIKHIIKSAGWVFGPMLLVMSIVLVALIVLLAMDLRLSVAIPPGFVEEFTDTINKRRFKEAFEMSRQDTSFLGRVLTTGMSRLQYGLEDAREASLNMVESLKASKEQLITYLATLGTLGPLVGLVGTVFGMILAFMELSVPGSTPKPDKLANGISHALVITLLGIALAVPSIFAHAFFRNRLIRITMDTSNLADDLLTQMYHNSKKAPGAPTGAPAPVDARAAQPGAIKPA
jgi:biopolymer transport protein ExbB